MSKVPYRLGDVVKNYNKFESVNLRQDTVNAYPDSIAAKYVLATENQNKINNMNILESIAKEHCKDIQGADVAIHIRLGDAFAPDGIWEYL